MMMLTYRGPLSKVTGKGMIEDRMRLNHKTQLTLDMTDIWKEKCFKLPCVLGCDAAMYSV